MKMIRRTIVPIVLILTAILMLAACGKKQPDVQSSAGAATPAATVTARPTATAEPTETARPAEAAEPTGTPTATATEEPSAATSAEEEAETAAEETGEEPTAEINVTIQKDGTYTGKEEVAAYIHLYGWLPDNFISKKEAEKLGWVSSKGNLWDVAPGMSIGGTRFGNYEGLLPEASGRKYYECDINYEGGYRGPERIVFSNDGLVFYTGDHYESYEQLYDENGPVL